MESPSAAMVGLREDHPVSAEFFSQERLKTAIARLWVRVVVQSHFEGEYQVAGISIIVGSKIFSIVRDLRFLSDRSRECEWWQLEALARRWLHRLRMLAGAWGKRRS